MPKAVEATDEMIEQDEQPVLDSKYRLIIIAAKRSKQLQRGARPRIDMDVQKHKTTRIALEEVEQGRIGFSILDGENNS
jgi:DNA-directed RNA polymerase omega subunit